jgi:Tol biopolymer transport system component
MAGNWRHQSAVRTARRRRSGARDRRRTRCLRLERLEDRRLLSIEQVSTCDPSIPGPCTTDGASQATAQAISGDGRYVTFHSAADNLISGDTNGEQDVFVRDLQAGTTTRVSTNSAGDQVSYGSRFGAFSADGRYVAFQSYAPNLAPGGTGWMGIYVKDLQTGATTRANTNTAGQEGGGSYDPAISGDGRYVAFWSYASNLVPGDTGWEDVFVKDRETGITHRASTDSAGNQANGESKNPVISDGGPLVAFQSLASNLVDDDTNGRLDVFVKNLQTGVTTRASTDSSGSQANGDSRNPAISADGRFVAFESSAGNLVIGDTNGATDVFVKELQTGIVTRVSTDASGSQANSASSSPALSADGRYVTFVSYASNLVSGDTNGKADVFVKDLQTGAIARVSVDANGNQANADSTLPAISADGRHITFTSAAGNLVPGDGNGQDDVFRVTNPLAPAGAAPTFGFALGIGSAGADAGNRVATDAMGNVYVTGLFQGTADFDPGPGVCCPDYVGGQDVFVAKYTPTGALVWARSIGGTGDDVSFGVAIAADGSVYTTGRFVGTVDFDPGPGTFNLSGTGEMDAFVWKLDSDGNFVWARRLGGTGAVEGDGVAVAPDGSVYAAGLFIREADFDPGPGTFVLTSQGGWNGFICKLDAQGNLVWARGLLGYSAYANDMALHPNGSAVYVTGQFMNTVDFDPGPGEVLLTSSGLWDIYVLKLDASGNLLWVRQMAGPQSEAGHGIAVGSDGSSYTTGYFVGTVDFDPGDDTYNLTSAGGTDIFVVKLDTEGVFSWAGAINSLGAYDEWGSDIALGSDGNVYFTGAFSETADFDPGPGTFLLTSAGAHDIFISRLDSEGDFVWACSMGGTGDDAGTGIAVVPDGGVYTTGPFRETADFDPGPGTFPLTSVGSSDVFLSKLQLEPGNVIPPVEDEVRVHLVPADLDGNPITAVAAGGQFTLQLWVEDLRPEPRGVFSAYADVYYDASLAAIAGDVVFDPQYPHGHNGDTAQPGLLDEVGAHAGTLPLGPGAQLLGSVPMVATAAGTLDFRSDPADAEVHQVVLYDALYATPPQEVEYGVASLRIVSAAPVADDDAYPVDEDCVLDVAVAQGVLANDRPGEGASLAARLVDGPTHGVVDMRPDGSFAYTPHTNYFGPDSFSYRTNDGILDSNAATVQITVRPVNDPPVGVSDVYSLNEDQTLEVRVQEGVLANDTDVERDPLSAEPGVSPVHGTLTLYPDGSLRYVPDAGFNGEDQFTYRADDGQLQSAETTVHLTIDAVNDAPEGHAQTLSTREDMPLEIILSGEDGDPEVEQSLAFVITSLPSAGSLRIVPNAAPLTVADLPARLAGNQIYFEPAAKSTATQTFTFYVQDDGGTARGGGDTSAEAAVTIRITHAPIANPDEYGVAPDGTLVVTPDRGVLANDADADGDWLTARLVDDAGHGTLQLQPDGSFTYVPSAGFTGTDGFLYRAGDGQTESSDTLVRIRVGGIQVRLETTHTDGTPLSSVLVGQTFLLRVLVQDISSDPQGVFAAYLDVTYDTEAIIVTGPLQFGPTFMNAHAGTAAAGLIDEAGGTDDFAPHDGGEFLLYSMPFTAMAVGTARFAADPADALPEHAVLLFGQAAPLPVEAMRFLDTSLDVWPVVDARDDAFTVAEDSSHNDLDILGNDESTRPVSLSMPVPAIHGTLAYREDGHVYYTPHDDYYGSDSFVYMLTDSHGTSDEATVVIAVQNLNDAPAPGDDAFQVDENSRDNRLEVLANDTYLPDPAERLAISAVSDPDHGGTVTIEGNGSWLKHQPAPNFFGTEQFTYTLKDEHGATAVATVTVTVDERNRPPTANDDAYTVYDDGTVVVLDVLANDRIAPDVDETLRVIAVTPPARGTVTLAPDGGTVLYRPNAPFSGSDEFTYKITDGRGGEAEARVMLTVRQYWQNLPDTCDVNNDGWVTPLDALLVINRLNTSGAGPLPPPQSPFLPPPYYDVNGDQHVTPLDVLRVVNRINQRAQGGEGETDAEGASPIVYVGGPVAAGDAAGRAPTPGPAWPDFEATLADLVSDVAGQPFVPDPWDDVMRGW